MKNFIYKQYVLFIYQQFKILQGFQQNTFTIKRKAYILTVMYLNKVWKTNYKF